MAIPVPRWFLVVLLCSGCGLMAPAPKQMYEGAPRAIDSVGVISEGDRAWTRVETIDGQYVVNPAVGAAPKTKGLHVLPGTHLVKVRNYRPGQFGMEAGLITSRMSYTEREIELTVEAGHTYVLRAETTSSGDRFWFDDKGVGYNQECLAPDAYSRMYRDGQSIEGC